MDESDVKLHTPVVRCKHALHCRRRNRFNSRLPQRQMLHDRFSECPSATSTLLQVFQGVFQRLRVRCGKPSTPTTVQQGSWLDLMAPPKLCGSQG